MPYDGSGNYTPPGPPTFPAISGDIIRAEDHNTLIGDIADALSRAILTDGQSVITADLSMNSHRLTNLTGPSSANDAATKSYVDTHSVITGDSYLLNVRSSNNYLSTAPLRPDLKITLVHIIIQGQSLADGEGGGGTAITTTAVSPGNVLMFQLENGAVAGPVVFDYAITGLTNLLEVPDRAEPTYYDEVIGANVPQNAVTGETVASALGKTIWDAIVANFATSPEQPLFKLLISIVGDGGQRYSHLKVGSHWGELERQHYIEGKALAAAAGYTYVVGAKIYIGGENDTSRDETGALNPWETPLDQCNKMLQLRRDFHAMVQTETAQNFAPPMIISQCDASEFTTNPPPEGRVPNVATGAMLASERDPYIKVATGEYTLTRRDGTHPEAPDTYNHGQMLAYPVLDSVFGIGDFQTLKIGMDPYWESSTDLIVPIEGGDHTPIRVSAYTAYQATLVNPGSLYTAGSTLNLFQGTASSPIVIQINTVTGGGGIDTFTMIDPGGFTTDPTSGGAATTVSVGVATAVLASAGTYTYVLNHVYTIDGGSFVRPATVRATAIDAVTGLVSVFTLVDPGIYSGSLPTNPASLTVGDATVTLTQTGGSGATFAISALYYPQATNLNPLLPVTSAGTNFQVGDILTAVGGSQPALANPLMAIVATVNGGGGITQWRIYSSGPYTSKPANPVAFTGGHGTGASTTLLWGGFPVTDPDADGGTGKYGLNPDDGTSDPPTILSVDAIAIRTSLRSAGIQNALRIKHNRAPRGSVYRLHHGVYRQANSGPQLGPRTCISSGPLGLPGKWGKFPAKWLARGTTEIFYPFNVLDGEPSIINGDFVSWSNGETVTLTTNGTGPDGWFLGRATGTVSAQIIKGASFDGESFPAKILRNPGDTATNAFAFAQSIDYAEVLRQRGQVTVVAMQMKKGANFSAASSQVTVSLYAGDTIAPLGSNGLPTSGVLTSLGSGVCTLTTTMQNFYTAMPIAVPADAKMLIVRVLWTPVGTAGADDSITLAKIQQNLGSVPQGFKKSSVASVLSRVNNLSAPLDFVTDFHGFEGTLANATDNDVPWANALLVCNTLQRTLKFKKRTTGLFAMGTTPGAVVDAAVHNCPEVAYSFIDIDARNVSFVCQTFNTTVNNSGASQAISRCFLKTKSPGGGYFRLRLGTLDGNFTNGTISNRTNDDAQAQVPLEVGTGYTKVDIQIDAILRCKAHIDTRIKTAIAAGTAYTADGVSFLRSGPFLVYGCKEVLVDYNLGVNYREGPHITATNTYRNIKFGFDGGTDITKCISSPLNAYSQAHTLNNLAVDTYYGETPTDVYSEYQLKFYTGKSRGSLCNGGGIGWHKVKSGATLQGLLPTAGVDSDVPTDLAYGEGWDFGSEINGLPTLGVFFEPQVGVAVHRYFIAVARQATSAVGRVIIQGAYLKGGWQGIKLISVTEYQVTCSVNDIIDYVGLGDYGTGVYIDQCTRGTLVMSGNAPGTATGTATTPATRRSTYGVIIRRTAHARTTFLDAKDWGTAIYSGDDSALSTDNNDIHYVDGNVIPTTSPAIGSGSFFNIGHGTTLKVLSAQLKCTINGQPVGNNSYDATVFAYDWAQVSTGRYLIPFRGYDKTTAGVAQGTGNIRMFRWYNEVPIHIQTALLRTGATVNAGANADIALYQENPITRSPIGAKIASTGSIAATAAATVISAALSVYLAPGWYWWAVNVDTNGNTNTFSAIDTSDPNQSQGQGSSSSSILTNIVTGLGKAGTYLTWPTWVGNITTDGLTTITDASVPAVFYRIA